MGRGQGGASLHLFCPITSESLFRNLSHGHPHTPHPGISLCPVLASCHCSRQCPPLSCPLLDLPEGVGRDNEDQGDHMVD